MSDGYLYDKIKVLNDVYNNTLLSNKIQGQSTLIKTELYPHQQTLVNNMHIYRNRMIRGFLLDNQAINGKFGIIGDPEGTGKTLSILAYLASEIPILSRITTELTNYSTKYFFSHQINQLSDISSTNLIIVPQYLFSQWKNEIIHHTNMDFIPIETKRVLNGIDLAKMIINAKFVLTTNKCYKYVQQYADTHNIQWNNIIIDEASSLYINSSDPALKFQFLWLITSNWIPLIFKTPSIIKKHLYELKDRINIHPELEKWLIDDKNIIYEGDLISSAYFKDYLQFYHPCRGCTVLRNYNDSIFNNSIHIPQIEYSTITCKANISLNSLTSYYLSRNIDPYISSEKVINLFQALGVLFKSPNTYIENQDKIKHNLINRKITDNECVICLDHSEYPTIVDCCYNIYCAKCLLKNMIINRKCPTCRDVLNTDNICCLHMHGNDNMAIPKNKPDACLDILRKYNNSNSKIIIYSSFNNIYYQMFEDIDKIGLKAERLETNLFSLRKSIRNYQENDTNVLFISNIELIKGLSLSSTSLIIFFHEQPVYDLKQVLINSAQRIGRKESLKIIHLTSEIQV